MEQFVKILEQEYSWLTFRSGAMATWSPEKNQITFNPKESTGLWSLLHELGHALLDHRSYNSDVDLLQKELQAWQEATSIAARHNIAISPDHVQNCLDTYRDWLYKRSSCPTCGSHGLQQSQALYRCLNCQGTWKVSSARFCRPYRLKKALTI